jgi:hypothetical protein
MLEFRSPELEISQQNSDEGLNNHHFVVIETFLVIDRFRRGE